MSGQQPTTTDHAAYDLKKLRGKQMVRRIDNTRSYEPIPERIKGLTALLVIRDKLVKPLLAGSLSAHPSRGTCNATALDINLRDYPSRIEVVAGPEPKWNSEFIDCRNISMRLDCL